MSEQPTCPAHPKRQGKAKPTKPCRGCWEVYGRAQGWTADQMRCELEWQVSMWTRLLRQVRGPGTVGPGQLTVDFDKERP